MSFDDLFSAPETTRLETAKSAVVVPVNTPKDIPSRIFPQSYPAVDHYRREFVKIFKETARYHHRYEVFRDFITVSAIALENACLKSQKLEEEYFAVIARYKPEDLTRFAQLHAQIVMGLEANMCDFLGSIFMELELGSDHMGQFFTPSNLSDLMAALTIGDQLAELEHSPYITMDECTCGAGGMVIAAVKYMLEKGYNPQKQLLVSCTDIDPVAARMCYIQLSLLGVSACVRIGNTLTQVIQRTMYTPFWYMRFVPSRH
nr:N-6 DNA methylase [Serratia fonticola]